jgi:hypothetical protein
VSSNNKDNEEKMSLQEAKEIVIKYEKLVNEAREVLRDHYSDVFRRMD